MNCYVYGFGAVGKERLIVVDLGVTFPDMESSPGVELIFPDIRWLEERADQIEGIFLTHAHEDHVGALGHLWSRLKAPVFARKFTAHHARRKMEEQGQPPEQVRTVDIWPQEVVTVGPFEVGFVPISHSIPESAGLRISTPGGLVIHSGDFKIDRTPGVGDAFDEALWRQACHGGVTAMMCDSTNVFVGHESRSETSLSPAITKLVSEAQGMVVATTFASNVVRLRTLANAGEAAGRSICLLGFAMRRMIEAAKETGVLDRFPKVISIEDAAELPRQNLMVLATGSQGERRAATAQLAQGGYRGLKMAEGDLFLFSSKTIPGNERGVLRIINQFSALGVDVVDDSSGQYHVSGHANRPDLAHMHNIVAPAALIPLHGEHRHLRAHAQLASASGIHTVIAPNGTMVDLSKEPPGICEYVETGRMYLDGSVIVGALDGVVRDRMRMAVNGHVMINVGLQDGTSLGSPWVDVRGLSEIGASGGVVADVLEQSLSQYLDNAPKRVLRDGDALEKELTRLTRNISKSEWGKRPEITVILSEEEAL